MKSQISHRTSDFVLLLCSIKNTEEPSPFYSLAFVSASIALVKEQAQENQNEKQNFTIVPIAENAVCHDFFPPLQ